LRDQPHAHRSTAPQLLRRLPPRQPVFALGERRQAIRISDTGDTVRPPGFARPGARASAIEGGRKGQITTDFGAFADERHAMVIGCTTMLPSRLAGHPECGVDPAVPVQLSDMCRRLRHGIHDSRLEEGADQAFFEGLWRRGMLPDPAEVLPQRESTLALLRTALDPLPLQRCQLRLDRRDPFQRRVPAPCSCACHQTGCGLAQVIWPSGPLRLIPRFFPRACSGLPCGGVCRSHLLQRRQGGLDTSGLKRLEDGGFDGPIDTQTADRQTRRGATVDAATRADVAGDPPRSPARSHLELAPTAPTAEHATPQGWPPLGSPPRPVLGPVAIGLQKLLMVQKVRPADGARVVLQQQHPPLGTRFFPTRGLPGAPILTHRFGLGAARDQGPGVGGSGEHLVDAMAPGQAPADLTSPGARVPLGQRQRRITIPPHRLAGTAPCAQLLEHARHGLRHLAVGDFFPAIIGCPHQPDRHLPQDMAPPDVCCEGLPRPLPPQAQCLFRHRALHAEHQAIVQLAGIINPLSIDAQGLGAGTQSDPMLPIPVVTGQAGGLQGHHRSDVALPPRGQPWATARALLPPGTATASVRIDTDDLGTPQGTGVVRQGIRPALALVVRADLMAGGLTDIDRGNALRMRATHLGAHGSAPHCARCG
jgi:hypothetical protein